LNVANSSSNTDIGPGGITTPTVNVITSVTVANNVTITTDRISVGNSTVNTVITPTSIDTDGTLAVLLGTTLSNTLSVGGLATMNTANVTGHLQAGSIAVGDTTISGNLTVTGTLTTVSANNITISDPMIQLASNNTTTDVLDIGFFGSYEAGDGGVHEHTGLFRDASDAGIYKLFQNLEPSPTTTVDTANDTFQFATLQTFLKSGGAGASGLISNSSTIAITANSTLNVAIVANTITTGNITITSVTLTGANSQDILVANSSGSFNAFGKGLEGTVLQIKSSLVQWDTLDGGTF
jgi:hypothetical protein